MKRHIALQPLTRDHHQGLILAQMIKKGAPQYRGMPADPEGKTEYTLSFYKTDLSKHFKEEEEILFPFVKAKDESLDLLIDEIISEHRKIETLVNSLKTKNNSEQILDELGKLLESHIRKEERNLFTEIEKILSEDELKILIAKFN
jgi:iron-sulfur cluster repair protein YtfE (RIC family)